MSVNRTRGALGVRDRPTAPLAPWQNGHIERLIGSIRRECLDHVVVVDEMHLRRILTAYAVYYNRARTHGREAVVSPTNPMAELQIKEAETAAQLLGMHLVVVNANDPSEFERVFKNLVEQRIDALIVE